MPIPQILRLLGAIFRVREARRNEIRSQPSVDSQHGETLGLVGPESPASLFEPIIPTFIVGWHRERLRVQPAFGALVGASAQAVPPDAPERRYALREVKVRLHQTWYRLATTRHRRGARN